MIDGWDRFDTGRCRLRERLTQMVNEDHGHNINTLNRLFTVHYGSLGRSHTTINMEALTQAMLTGLQGKINPRACLIAQSLLGFTRIDDAHKGSP